MLGDIRVYIMASHQLWLTHVANHTLWVKVLVYLLRVRRNVAETMPTAQRPLPGQAAGSGLLGVHKQGSIVDSHRHTQRYFQDAQFALHGRFSFYSDNEGLWSSQS